MSAVSMRRDAIEALLSELNAIEDVVHRWQVEESAPALEVRDQHARYLSWYTQAQGLMTNVDLDRFREMYNGSIWTPRIKSFFADPLKPNILYNSDNPLPGLSKWSSDFTASFKASADTQREILIKALQHDAGIDQELAELAAVFQRIPRYLSVLHDPRNETLPKPEITNERDLQQVVSAVLSLIYDDVRPEDYVSQHGGRRTRVDFFIGDVGILVETKMTRESLRDKEVGDELLEDFGRYPSHAKYKAIFALVYDPGRLLRNPAGLQKDLTRSEAGLLTHTLVVH